MEIFKIVIEWVFIWVFLVILTIELVNLSFYGYHYIYGNGLNLLIKEMEYCSTLIFKSMINLDNKTELNAGYISDSIPSFITPYYVRCGKELDVNYRVIRWSKAYFIIKDKYKELYPPQNEPKHIKF